MAAIFISYTGRDAEGEAWADRLQDWCEEWGYGFFRDKHHSAGVKAGADWRAQLYRELALATVMVCLCTRRYDRSPWCVGEVAIAVARGTTVIPIQLVNTARQLQTIPLPLLLQTDQAIQVTGAAAPAAATLADVKRRLQRSLTQALNWRALLSWQEHWKPYPGLPAFEEHQAPVFFGRDDAITAISRRLSGLLQQAPALLLLLGASGYGKSSLVKAGVVPKLRAERQPHPGGEEQPSWLVLQPFKPEAAPFAALQAVLAAAGCPGDGSDPLRQLQALSSARQRPVLLVIDQFEELLTTAAGSDGAPGEGGRFLAFLQALLEGPPARVLVLATMRTDYLAPLQSAWPRLAGLAITETLEPIAAADFGQLIRGPADRAALKLQPGLEERLVGDSGGADALPLLAFTLEKLWEKRQERGGPVPGEPAERWDFTVADYNALGGVAGSVRSQAEACWQPARSSPQEAAALRQAFLGHLLSLDDDGRAAKRPARLQDLPPASRLILERMVKKRLLVSSSVNDPETGTDHAILDIAHEALLRTWEPLVEWIEEGREELLQARRLQRLLLDLAAHQPLAARLGALQALLAQAEAQPVLVAPAVPAVGALLLEGGRSLEECRLAVQLLALAADPASAEALGGFLERRQIHEPLPHQQAGPWLEALAEAAAALQALLRSLPPAEAGAGPSALLLPCARLSGAGPELAISTELVRLQLWATPQVQAPGAWFEPLGEGVALTMVVVPPGRFLMGSPPEEPEHANDEGSQHEVQLAGFAIGQAPITQAQWRAVASWQPRPGESWLRELQPEPSQFVGDGRPVERVSWLDAMEFCRRLSQRSGRPYALPSEARWEYACRAGSTTPFHCGHTILAPLANYDATYPYGSGSKGDYRAQTSTVGLFPANAWGLHDMHGNVQEWCLDEWHESYQEAPADGRPWLDPAALTDGGTGPHRLLRGGSWNNYPGVCCAACRIRFEPDNAYSTVGFRVVCLPQGPSLNP